MVFSRTSLTRMRASQLEALLNKIPQIKTYFAGTTTIDSIPKLAQEEFTIINTE